MFFCLLDHQPWDIARGGKSTPTNMRPSGAKILFWGLLPLLALGGLLVLSYPTGEEQTPTVTPESLPTPVEITVTPPKTIEEPQTPLPITPVEKKTPPPQKHTAPTPPAAQPPRTLPPRQTAPTLLPPTALLPPQPHPTENSIAPIVEEQAITPTALPATEKTVDTAHADAAVYDSAQVDAPPYAKTPIRPAFPLRARRDGVSGSVLLEFIVDASGTPHEIHILSATPQGYFEQAALHAVATTHFSPASKNSRPVPCKVTLPLVFQVRE